MPPGVSSRTPARASQTGLRAVIVKKEDETDEELLKRITLESIREARAEGVSLEAFLAAQHVMAPNNVTDGARAVMYGWAVLLWFRMPS